MKKRIDRRIVARLATIVRWDGVGDVPDPGVPTTAARRFRDAGSGQPERRTAAGNGKVDPAGFSC